MSQSRTEYKLRVHVEYAAGGYIIHAYDGPLEFAGPYVAINIQRALHIIEKLLRDAEE